MFFSDYFVLSLDMQGAQLIRCKRGFSGLGIQPQVEYKSALTMDSQAATNTTIVDISSGGYPWSESLRMANTLVQQLPTKAELKVVISNQYVRYKVLPALPPMTSQSEAVSMAKHALMDVFGDVVEHWRIVVNPLPHGESVLLCAVDEALLLALQEMTGKYGVKLTSIQPYFMAGFNTLHKSIDGQYACFIQVETNRISIAMIRDQSWESVSSQLVQADTEAQIIGLIKREMLLVGWPEKAAPTLYFSTFNGNKRFSLTRMRELAEFQHWSVEWLNTPFLKGGLPEQDHPYALAIAGV